MSARLDSEFVRSEVKRLEKLGCIQKVSERPYIVLPLSSVFSKKKRVVVDASRALNPFLKHRRLRLQVGVLRLFFGQLLFFLSLFLAAFSDTPTFL